jgi:cholinesterase
MVSWGIRDRVKQYLAVGVVVTLLVLSFQSGAFSYDRILAFGDSLSDNGAATDGYGNSGVLFPGMQTPTVYSNGPVWVEHLADAAHLGVPLFDMAYGGAETGFGDSAWKDLLGENYYRMWGLNWQVDEFLGKFPDQFSQNTLVTVWAGANNVLSMDPSTSVPIFISASKAARDVREAIEKLITPKLLKPARPRAGFRKFLVLNLPDVGRCPYFTFAAPNARPVVTAWCKAFNTALKVNMQLLKRQHPLVEIHMVDTYALFNTLLDDPGAYGFDNVVNCMLAPVPGCTCYFFWDYIHPTTQAHALVADAVYKELSLPILPIQALE